MTILTGNKHKYLQQKDITAKSEMCEYFSLKVFAKNARRDFSFIKTKLTQATKELGNICFQACTPVETVIQFSLRW